MFRLSTTLTLLLGFFIVAISCKNEPYITPALGVSAFRTTNPSSSRSFHYRSNKVDALSVSMGGAATSMKVYYRGDRVHHITADSTETSKRYSLFYYNGLDQIDTLKLIDTAVHVLQIRKVTYDAGSQPVSVSLTTFGATETIYRRADLTWSDGNVIRLVITNTADETVLTDATITHVLDKPGIFEVGVNQFYGLALDELYWLSKKNPETITTATGTADVIYAYNKLDYPSGAQIGTTSYGVGYVQIFE